MSESVKVTLTSAAMLGVALSASPAASARDFAQDPPVNGADVLATCLQPAPPVGLRTLTVHSEGRMRSYVAFVPSAYDGRAAVPAVLEFHGSGSDPRQQLAISGMAGVAEHQGLIVLLPIAAVPYGSGGYTWNVPASSGHPDDIRFSLDVLEHARTWACIDDRRVYAMGFSGGARLVSLLACAAPTRFAAVAAVGGLRSPAERCGEGAVAVIAFHGTADPINPFTGGGPVYWGASIDRALAGWARRNACDRLPDTTRVSDAVTRLGYLDCDAGEVVFYRIDGGGHTWPGSQFVFPSGRFGRAIGDVDATAVIAGFFTKHTRRH